MKKSLFLLALLSAFSAHATGVIFPHQNPKVVEVNRVAMRSSFIVYPTADKAVPGSCYRNSSNYQTIEGKWNFVWFKSLTDAYPEEFFSLNYDDSKWNKMVVPGLWKKLVNTLALLVNVLDKLKLKL